MTANPDSALRQALVAAEKALAPFAAILGTKLALSLSDGYEPNYSVGITIGDLRRAREAHALITEALQQHNHGAVE